MREESKVQKKVCNYAKSKEWLVYRLKERGKPDRMFLKEGFTFFIEFKDEEGKLSELQKIEIHTLEVNGFRVFVIDNFNHGKFVIDWMDDENAKRK